MIAQRRKRRRGGISLHLSALKENKATRRGEIRKRKQDGKTFRGRSRRKMDEEFPSYRQNGKFRREKSRKWKRDTAGRSIREEGGRMKILGSRWWLCQGKRKREAYGTFLFCCALSAREEYWNRILWAGKRWREERRLWRISPNNVGIRFCTALDAEEGPESEFHYIQFFRSASHISPSSFGVSARGKWQKKLCGLPCTDSDE